MLHSDFTIIIPATKAQAKGVDKIHYGVGQSPFGEFFLATTEQGICRASFIFEHDVSPELAYLAKHWPKAKLIQDSSWVQPALDSWFGLKQQRPHTIQLHLVGSEFQLAVWQRLLAIPLGATTTYQTIAQQVDRPKAFRAVGTAVGQNPITFLLPCHRVLQSGGGLGGYFWGLDLKRALLAWEGV